MDLRGVLEFILSAACLYARAPAGPFAKNVLRTFF